MKTCKTCDLCELPDGAAWGRCLLSGEKVPNLAACTGWQPKKPEAKK